MYLQIKAKHYKNAPFQHMHDCPTCNALKEVFKDFNGGFNGNTVTFSQKEFYGNYSLEKIDGKWREETYLERDAKKDYDLAKKDNYGESVIRTLHIFGLEKPANVLASV